MTYLISLISDHSLPNYLFIKEMAGKYDQLLFITTIKMQAGGKAKYLELALGLNPNSVPQIVVSEDNLAELNDILERYSFNKNDRYIVNITGGTKIMSIGISIFFAQFNAQSFYIPIGKNTICNLNEAQTKNLNYRIGLEEYLTLYGLRIESNLDLSRSKTDTFSLFESYKRVNFSRKNCYEIENASNFETETERSYYSGVWFEEYVFLRLKEELQLRKNAISKSVKIYRNNSDINNDNEIDIMFVLDNKLYVGECKVSMVGYQKKGIKLVEEFLYKLAAISRDFGLQVNPYLFTLHQMSYFNHNQLQAIEKRKKILGIKGLLAANDFTKKKLEL